RLERPGELVTAPEEVVWGISASYPTYWNLPRAGRRLHAAAMAHSLEGHVRAVRQQFPFDVILAAWAYPDAVAAAYLAAQLGCPLVSMVLGSDINELARYAPL